MNRFPMIRRLAFYTVDPLRLRSYTATLAGWPSRRTSWGTLAFWEQLLDGVPRWPDPDAPPARISVLESV